MYQNILVCMFNFTGLLQWIRPTTLYQPQFICTEITIQNDAMRVVNSSRITSWLNIPANYLP